MTCPTDNSWYHYWWSCDEWKNDRSSVDEWQDKIKNCVSSLTLGCFDLDVMDMSKRFELVKINLDTGAAVDTLSLNFSYDAVGGVKILSNGQWRACPWRWSFYKFKITMKLIFLELWMEDSLIHKECCVVLRNPRDKRRRDFPLTFDDEFMMSVHSENDFVTRIRFDMNWCGGKSLTPIYDKGNIFKLSLSKKVKSTEINDTHEYHEIFKSVRILIFHNCYNAHYVVIVLRAFFIFYYFPSACT